MLGDELKDRTASKEFAFVSYGVNISIKSSIPDLVDEAELVARKSLMGRLSAADAADPDYVFMIEPDGDGTLFLFQNGEYLSSGPSHPLFFRFLDSILRISVARDSRHHIFMHAGVVGWNGRAIVIPGDSYNGKSTLVAELVRNGAVYYSDEFAIFDDRANVHPFQRPIAMRTDGEYKPYEITVESLGGTSAQRPIPVGMVLLAKYRKGGRWMPRFLTPGNGVLEMIPHTISFNNSPDYAFKVLKNIASDAIIAASSRGSAVTFAKTLLNFVDRHVPKDDLTP